MITDLVNATARPESLNKHYGVPLIITRQVYAKLAPQPARVLDRSFDSLPFPIDFSSSF